MNRFGGVGRNGPLGEAVQIIDKSAECVDANQLQDNGNDVHPNAWFGHFHNTHSQMLIYQRV